jgi:ABC-type antimicrobial peptide transport system permease subunit
MQSGVVTGVTRSLSPSTDIYSHNTIDNWPGRMANEPLSIAMNAVADSDYFRTLGMSFAAGSNFTGNLGADTTTVILNEAAVRRMRLKDPINAVITWSVSNAPNRLRVVGVVKDALVNDPFAQPEPMMFVYQPDWTGAITYRLAPAVSTSVALAKLGAIYRKYNGDYAFDYSFADENYAGDFALELLIGKLAGVFAALAIFISCLGLFGLAAYVAEQRTKEIGIRKVLGASTRGITYLLSKDFLRLTLLSCVVAFPVSAWMMYNWLQGYSYRIELSWWIFALAGGLAVFIALATVSYQAVRAALANPAASLKAE